MLNKLDNYWNIEKNYNIRIKENDIENKKVIYTKYLKENKDIECIKCINRLSIINYINKSIFYKVLNICLNVIEKVIRLL